MALKLDATLRFGDIGQLTHSETSDVSRDGVFLVMRTPRPIGTRVHLVVEIADSSQRFELEGVVVRQVSDGATGPGGHPLQPGIGVFLIKASAGWVEFCTDVSRRRREARPSIP